MERHEDERELVVFRRKVDDLNIALETRHTIGLAQGLLMARYGLTAEQAFEYLRRRSQDGNVKLRRLADRVVEEWLHAECRLGEFDPLRGEPV